MSDDLHKRLVRAKLVQPRHEKTLGAFLTDYIERHRKTIKAATVTTWRQAERLLLAHFPKDISVRSITEGKAVEWRAYLIGRGLAEATVRRRCGAAKQMFAQAVRLELVDANPFDSKSIPTTSPRSTQKAFIDTDLADRIIDELPDAQWRLLFALARWGGLRVGSEPRALTWSDVDWERRRLNVPSPKTEHHAGQESRLIPLFPEIAGPLQEVYDAAPEGQALVLPFLVDRTDASLRKIMLPAIKRAGAKPWPKLWTALRATRDTELRDKFPGHVVSQWIGHDQRVAERHYLQVTDKHFEQAAPAAGEVVRELVRNPVQHGKAGAGIEVRNPNKKGTQPQGTACSYESMGDTGLAHLTNPGGKRITRVTALHKRCTTNDNATSPSIAERSHRTYPRSRQVRTARPGTGWPRPGPSSTTYKGRGSSSLPSSSRVRRPGSSGPRCQLSMRTNA
ncbi:MAG: phage integrase SAM-like domain-containing protein [Planctomycetota bacterium]